MINPVGLSSPERGAMEHSAKVCGFCGTGPGGPVSRPYEDQRGLAGSAERVRAGRCPAPTKINAGLRVLWGYSMINPSPKRGTVGEADWGV